MTFQYFSTILIALSLCACVSPKDETHSETVAPASAHTAEVEEPQFVYGKCYKGRGPSCVIDGDTFYVGYDKVRIADIDTPETYRPKCEYEAQLGARATDRMIELLNAGPFDLVTSGQDTDRYGRYLRTVERNGQSLGSILVSEGLARPWTGRRRSWC
ncbi:thermonuclease family protein [Pseudovibrio denitrificans]|uniref:thermonuclease family protein n=1 Tax=Pseudovibrio denitrificans TaxID=258256 RepID=UPI0039BED1EC